MRRRELGVLGVRCFTWNTCWIVGGWASGLGRTIAMVSSYARSSVSSFTWNSGALFTVQFALRTGVTDLSEPSYRL